MADRLQISLEIEPTEPIRGSLRDQAGDEHEFSGWLEMSSMIEDVWSAARRPEPAPPAAETSGGSSP